MRALVTGANGFVGRYLCEALADSYDVVPAGGPDASSGLKIDLSDALEVRAAIDIARPDAIFHLAAQTFVPNSLESPMATYETNIMGTAHLLESLRDYRDATGNDPRLVFVSSAETYGAHPAAELPLREDAELRPANPYAGSKAAAEMLVLSEVRSFRLNAIVTRAFNHIGPGQSERFVVASLAAQLAEVAARRAPFLSVGNLAAQRDFLDVRDVVRAYVLLAGKGQSGEVYNVCSGSAVAISDILRRLVTIAHVAVEIREDASRMRPADVACFYGDNCKLREQTGWEARFSLDTSLRDIYAAATGKASAATPE